MSVKYIPSGSIKIVVDKVTYQNKDGKNAVLPADKLGKEELERLLEKRLIKKIEFDEKDSSREKSLDRMNKEELTAKAVELGIVVEETATRAQILAKITEAQANTGT